MMPGSFSHAVLGVCCSYVNFSVESSVSQVFNHATMYFYTIIFYFSLSDFLFLSNYVGQYLQNNSCDSRHFA